MATTFTTCTIRREGKNTTKRVRRTIATVPMRRSSSMETKMLTTKEKREELVVVVVAIRMRVGCSLQKFNLRKMNSSDVADSRGPLSTRQPFVGQLYHHIHCRLFSNEEKKKEDDYF